MGKPFDISTYPNIDIQSFELEELVGKDSLDAFARLTTPGGAPPPATAVGTLHLNQLIAQSISKVNGELVVRPYTAWQNWTLRTQEFVVTAFTRYNGITQEERQRFVGELRDTHRGLQYALVTEWAWVAWHLKGAAGSLREYLQLTNIEREMIRMRVEHHIDQHNRHGGDPDAV